MELGAENRRAGGGRRATSGGGGWWYIGGWERPCRVLVATVDGGSCWEDQHAGRGVNRSNEEESASRGNRRCLLQGQSPVERSGAIVRGAAVAAARREITPASCHPWLARQTTGRPRRCTPAHNGTQPCRRGDYALMRGPSCTAAALISCQPGFTLLRLALTLP